MDQLQSMFESKQFEEQAIKNDQQLSEDADSERALIVDLIETVKGHPSLYDRQAGNFQDGRNRQCLWQNVGEEMKEKGHNVKGGLCREKWNSLKRRYVRELAAIASSAGYSPRASKWPYFGFFDFLHPFVQQNLPSVIKNEKVITVDAENEAAFSGEQAFDENLGKILGLETAEPRKKRLRSSRPHKEPEERNDEFLEDSRLNNHSMMVKIFDTRNEAFVTSLCGLSVYLDDEKLAAFQKDTLCDLARRMISSPGRNSRNSHGF